MLRTAGLCLFVSIFSHSLWSQTDTLSGTVMDATQAVLPRATVRVLTESGTEISRTLTDTQGRFQFDGLSQTMYTLEVSLIGFEKWGRSVRPGKLANLILLLAPVRERIVVTATRTEAPTSQIASSITVLEGEEIAARQEISASEILQLIPGAIVVRTGGLGNFTSLFIRGGEGDYNKVLLDGIPLNEPGGTFQFDSLTMENIERIEVVRGPQSALFGSDAMSSVVQLFTKRGSSETRRPRISLSLEGGKYETWRGRTGISGNLGHFDYSTNFARVETSNQEPHNDFRSNNFSGNFGYSPKPGTDIRLVLRGTSNRVGTPGNTAFARPDRGSTLHKTDGAAGISLRNQTTPSWDQQVRYTFARSRQVSRDTILDPPYVPQFEDRSAPFQFFDFPSDFLNDTRRRHFSYQSNVRLDSIERGYGLHLLTFLFDWDHEQGFLQDRIANSSPTDAQRDNFGWVMQHQAIWRNLVFTNGVRMEDNDGFGLAVVPRTSLALTLQPGQSIWGATKLKFNFGLGIKEPTMIESFSPSPSFPGNPDLNPERARSFDFGIEQRFWRNFGKLDLTWFQHSYRDLVSFLVTGFNPTRGSFFNVAENKASGAEVTLELNPLRSFRTRVTYTYLDAETVRTSNPTDPGGLSLIRRPRHSGSFSVYWNRDRITLSSDLVFVGSRRDNDFSFLQPALTSNEGYSKLDLDWMYRLQPALTLFGTFENILNEKYMEALGFPALRFTYRSGIRLEF